MSATLEATRPAGQKKKFGKTERHIPHHTEKAKKWYAPEDEVTHKKVGSFSFLWRRHWGAGRSTGSDTTVESEAFPTIPYLYYFEH